MPPSDLCAGVFDVNGSDFLVLEWRMAVPAHAAGGTRLTEAEKDVVMLLLEGHSNATIATRRGTSARTVAKQVASAFGKIGVRSRPELFAASARGVLRSGR